MNSLEGIRVLDLTRAMAGPVCTMILGDLGADVIKLERPETGDESRGWGPPFVGKPYGPYPGESAYFLAVNRNKRSVTVNLKSKEGQEIVRNLALHADILVENFISGTLDKLNLGYESLQDVNPKLIYCSVSGYGRTGPCATQPGYDFILQAECGLMSITGPEEGPPYRMGVPIVDITAGMYATIAILAALRERELSGAGQFVETSLLETAVSLLTNVASSYLVSGNEPKRYGNSHPSIAPYEVFRARDRWFTLGVANNKQWEVLCSVLESPELIADPRFDSNLNRVANISELRETLNRIFSTRLAGEWLDDFRKASLPSSPINTLPEVFEHPQVLARCMAIPAEHPTVGEMQVTGFAYNLSSTPANVRLAPPLLGQHTDEVLSEQCNYDPVKIKTLHEQGVI
jgi:crotonobetainyl-CoA:carnitine CoA-transferase CaiB-like acyl-CoA transferase